MRSNVELMSSRPEFRSWVDNAADPGWKRLPLTHIAKGLIAGDIVREGRITPSPILDDTLKAAVSFFFYGRPAYRVHGDGAIKEAATCPFLFLFDPDVVERACSIHAFDTGAFGRRLYSHALMDEMNVEDFCLEKSPERPNKLISLTFGDLNIYFDGDTSRVFEKDAVTTPDQFLARAYIDLLKSPGRNEPDDRVGTIEVILADPLPLQGTLMAVVVPHMLWDGDSQTHWLKALHESGVEIRPFRFVPGRSADFYMQNLESEARRFYEEKGFLG